MQSHEAGARRTSEQPPGAGLSKGLGWFSVGLGIAELAAPRALARAIGIDHRGRTGATIRAMGARELANGLGILARPRRSLPLWARVAGDAIDLAFLAWAFGAKRTHTQRLVGAIASVAGVAALDILASRRTARAQAASGKPIFRTITIYRPAADVYAFWRDFEQLPMFMEHLESVVDLGNKRSRWTAKLPTGALPRLSSRTSTRPLTPAGAPDATRATNWCAAVLLKSTPLNWSQSPLAMKPTSCPPPASVVASSWVPLCALEASAWIVPYAPVPDGGGGGGGVVVPPPPPEVYAAT